MSADNYTVRAVCFYPLEMTVENLRNLNRLIIGEMSTRLYYCEEADTSELLIGGRPRMTLTFFYKLIDTANSFPDKSLKRKLSNVFRIQDTHMPTRKEAFNNLERTIDALPLNVTYRFYSHNLPNATKGIRCEIDSEPAIITKMRSLHKPRTAERTQYDDIIAYSKKFIRDIASSVGMNFLTDPAPISIMEFPKLPAILEFTYTSTYPDDVRFCLDAANECFIQGHTLACSILLRKAMEVAITKKFQQEGKANRLVDKEGNEFTLKKSLNIVWEAAPKTKYDLDQIRLVKWLTDKAVHDPSFRITPEDIQSNILIFKTFMSNLQLKT